VSDLVGRALERIAAAVDAEVEHGEVVWSGEGWTTYQRQEPDAFVLTVITGEVTIVNTYVGVDVADFEGPPTRSGWSAGPDVSAGIGEPVEAPSPIERAREEPESSEVEEEPQKPVQPRGWVLPLDDDAPGWVPLF
jgi:hypothetical protein